MVLGSRVQLGKLPWPDPPPPQWWFMKDRSQIGLTWGSENTINWPAWSLGFRVVVGFKVLDLRFGA